MKKIIQYRTKEVYGNPLDYVINQDDAKLIQKLTGKKTVDSVIRELIHDLSNGMIQFQQVL